MSSIDQAGVTKLIKLLLRGEHEELIEVLNTGTFKSGKGGKSGRRGSHKKGKRGSGDHSGDHSGVGGDGDDNIHGDENEPPSSSVSSSTSETGDGNAEKFIDVDSREAFLNQAHRKLNNATPLLFAIQNQQTELFFDLVKFAGGNNRENNASSASKPRLNLAVQHDLDLDLSSTLEIPVFTNADGENSNTSTRTNSLLHIDSWGPATLLLTAVRSGTPELVSGILRKVSAGAILGGCSGAEYGDSEMGVRRSGAGSGDTSESNSVINVDNPEVQQSVFSFLIEAQDNAEDEASGGEEVGRETPSSRVFEELAQKLVVELVSGFHNNSGASKSHPLVVEADTQRTLLHFAVLKGALAICHWIGRNAERLRLDPNQRDIQGNTALALAIHAKNPEIIVALLETNCDARVTDSRQNTALHLAAELSLSEVIRRKIIEAGNAGVHSNEKVWDHEEVTDPIQSLRNAAGLTFTDLLEAKKTTKIREEKKKTEEKEEKVRKRKKELEQKREKTREATEVAGWCDKLVEMYGLGVEDVPVGGDHHHSGNGDGDGNNAVSASVFLRDILQAKIGDTIGDLIKAKLTETRLRKLGIHGRLSEAVLKELEEEEMRRFYDEQGIPPEDRPWKPEEIRRYRWIALGVFIAIMFFIYYFAVELSENETVRDWTKDIVNKSQQRQKEQSYGSSGPGSSGDPGPPPKGARTMPSYSGAKAPEGAAGADNAAAGAEKFKHRGSWAGDEEVEETVKAEL